ncbi:MAG: hypothetical protein K6347_02110 [Campylobacterales bacterium]
MTERLLIFLYKLLSLIIKPLSYRGRRRLARLISTLWWHLDPRRRKIALSNLNLVYGDTKSQEKKEQIAKASFLSVSDTLVDFIRREKLEADEIKQSFIITGSDVIHDALSQDRKIICITPHFGNWELTSIAYALTFGPISVVARPLDVAALEELFKRNRERFGVEVISKFGAMRGMVKAISSGRAIGLLIDQSVDRYDGVVVNFLGVRSYQTPAAALLALKNDALVVPVFCSYQEDGRYIVDFRRPIDAVAYKKNPDPILSLAQAQADALSEGICANPGAWMWMHNRWKHRPDLKE